MTDKAKKERINNIMNVVVELSLTGTKAEKNMSNQLLSDPEKFANYIKTTGLLEC